MKTPDIDRIEMKLWADVYTTAIGDPDKLRIGAAEEMADTARGKFRDRFRAEPKAGNKSWNKEGG